MTSPKTDPKRVVDQPAFILHTYPWRETSLLVEALTRDYGRVGLVAKGAKRPASKFRGLLNPFSPLSVSFSGKSEMKTLTDVSWLGTIPLSEMSLMSAFYLNELIVRLTARFEQNPQLFSCYLRALKGLSSGDDAGVTLRHFEMDLLQIIGYGLPDTHFPQEWYVYSQGDIFSVPGPTSYLGPVASGKALEDLVARRLQPGREEKEVKGILQAMIGFYLEGKPLNTKRIVEELRRV